MSESSPAVSLTSPRLLFPLVGAAQGQALYVLPEQDTVGVGLALTLYLAPWLGLLAWRPGRTRESIGIGVAFAAVVAGLGAWSALRFGQVDEHVRADLFGAALALALAVLALSRRLRTEAFQAPQDATGLLVALESFAIGWLFAGILFLVLQLWSALFELIGIEIFNDIFGAEAFLYPVMFGAAALGFAIVGEWPVVRRALRWLVTALAKLLAPVLALAVLIFVGALPFTGLAPLWATGSATALLLSVQLAALLFAHLLAEAAARDEVVAPPVRWLVAVELLVVPVLSALALYALYLRFGQYGLTAERLLTAIAAVLTALAALWSALSVLIGRFDWTRALGRANPIFLTLSGVVAAALFTPLLDPWGLSAKAQYAELASGRIAAEAFDFGYLKFRLGRHGAARLAQIRANPELSGNPEIARRLAALASFRQYYDWKRAMRSGESLAARLGGLETLLTVVPAGSVVPDGLAGFMFQSFGDEMEVCGQHRRCHLLAVNMDDDAADEYVLVIPEYHIGAILFDRSGERWRGLKSHENYLRRDEVRPLAAGGYGAVAPSYKDLRIGERRFGFIED